MAKQKEPKEPKESKGEIEERRIYVSDANKAGEKVLLKGWVHDIRDIGKIKFLLLRDVTGIIQVTAVAGKINEKILQKMSKISRESVIAVSGVVKESKQAPGGFEISPEKIEMIAEAEAVLPIDISDFSKTELPKRLDWRSLDLRRKDVKTIFKIRSKFLQFAVNWLTEKGFIQINSPKIASVGAEGGANIFSVPYFDKSAFLTQSPQFYKQEVQPAFEKVFEIGECFRAEPHHTPRHLCEFTGLDFEISFIKNEEDVMRVCEQLLHDVLLQMVRDCKKELALLKIKINAPKIPFPQIGVEEALKLTRKAEIDPEAEKKISELALQRYGSEFIWLRNYPWKLKPFYTMKTEDEKFGKDFDLIFNGLEIVTGSQREHRYKVLLKQLKEKGFNPKHFESYLNAFKFGMPPHGGLGLGIDRFIKQLLNLENVREAVLFPRDPERIVP